ncbi:hypothetical protein HOLleu_36157 [Holothuria leucospilota]|uniref:Uncharacterized protein n=1 Tax=Holothuria leucospilota TaxID=206669 RepID=A0A9Q1BEH1_HOLLE|nr:hypothetical protein HOLleu_36157 [Holothuria leucospilota]
MNTINIFHLNINSIYNKTLEVLHYLNENNIHITRAEQHIQAYINHVQSWCDDWRVASTLHQALYRIGCLVPFTRHQIFEDKLLGLY